MPEADEPQTALFVWQARAPCGSGLNDGAFAACLAVQREAELTAEHTTIFSTVSRSIQGADNAA